MATLCLLIYAFFCLIVDGLRALGNAIGRASNRTKQQEQTTEYYSNKNDDSISMNELLTFEELLEDDENN